MYCKHCGFALSEDVNYCPACGKKQTDPVEKEPAASREAPAPTQTTIRREPINTLCIVGFVLSCSSFLLTLFGVTALSGLICSLIGLKQLQTRNERGKGLAVAGIVLAIVSILLFFLLLYLMQYMVASGQLPIPT